MKTAESVDWLHALPPRILCPCQSQGNGEYDCTDFACVDPEAPCVDDDDVTVDMVANCGDIASIGEVTVARLDFDVSSGLFRVAEVHRLYPQKFFVDPQNETGNHASH